MGKAYLLASLGCDHTWAHDPVFPSVGKEPATLGE